MAKMNKFAKKAAEMEAWADLLDYAKKQLEYTMEIKTDENGDEVLDKDGFVVRIAPTEDENRYDYSRYIGWYEVVKSLEALKL